MREEILELTCKTPALDLIKYTKLPFPCCFFEIDLPTASEDGVAEGREDYNKIGIVITRRHEGDMAFRLLIVRARTKDESIQFNGVGGELRDDGKIYAFNIREVKIEEYDREPVVYFVNMMIQILYAINCQGLLEHEKSDFARLNKWREKSGKLPLREYSTIKISLTKEERDEKKEGGKHNSPRMHLRRGHFRNLPTRAIWVRNCVVGKGEQIKQKYIIRK